MKSLWRLLRYDWPLHFVLLFTNWLPDNVVILRLRGGLVRPFLGSCGKNLRLGRCVTFYNPSAIHMGRDVYIALGSWFMAGAPISIGDEVLFGPYCVIVSANHIRQNDSYRFGPAQQLPISVGSGCWFGAHVTLTAGAEIGAGCLVAANSVAGGKLESNWLAGGVPAKPIKNLG